MDIKALIDPEGGLVDRRIFADREIYELERERLFARCWLYLGHECEIPNPGDFVTRYMGEEPVILCRDQNGKLRAHLNLCRHRGNRVCRADRGNTKLFTCSYHGWSYTSDGKLALVPKVDAFKGLEREKWGLIPVAQIDSYKGLILRQLEDRGREFRRRRLSHHSHAWFSARARRRYDHEPDTPMEQGLPDRLRPRPYIECLDCAARQRPVVCAARRRDRRLHEAIRRRDRTPTGKHSRSANHALRGHGLPQFVRPLAHAHDSRVAAARAGQDGDLELGDRRQSGVRGD